MSLAYALDAKGDQPAVRADVTQAEGEQLLEPGHGSGYEQLAEPVDAKAPAGPVVSKGQTATAATPGCSQSKQSPTVPIELTRPRLRRD